MVQGRVGNHNKEVTSLNARPPRFSRIPAMNGGRHLRSFHGSDPKDNVCRIVVLGNPGVGKTALTVRFLTKRFIGEYCPTLESVYRYNSTSPEEDDIRLDILDTAGTMSCDWKDCYALWGDCFVFVYSITELASFEEVQRLRRQVESVRRCSSLCSVIVGNKSDLVYDRKVATSQGQEVAAEFGCNFYEVSACDWNQLGLISDLFTNLYTAWRGTRTFREGRQRKASSSAKFKLAIQKVISGKSATIRRGASGGSNH